MQARRSRISGIVRCAAVLSVGVLPAFAVSPSSTRPISKSDTVLAVYRENWGLGSDPTPALIVAAWPDGHVVWSGERIRGGPPYSSGQVDPARVRELLANLDREGIYSDRKLARANFGPDSTFTTMLFKHGQRKLEMRSWHEVAELNVGTVATHAGLEALGRRKRDEVLRKEPEDYRRYRTTWADLRKRLSALIPKTGTPIQGKVQILHRELTWTERPAGEAR